ncbi:SpoIIE family protein phosphatase [bacterium]|nr:SpoIIE family protein phosphatase [bacterium]
MKIKSYLLLLLIFITKSISLSQIPISIDAEKDAFYDQLHSPEEGYLFIPHSDYLSYCGPEPSGDDDLSAQIWMAWDDVYFYLYAEVRDDIIRVNNEARYENDCMELKFDPDPTVKPLIGVVNARLSALDSTDADNIIGVDNFYSEGNLDSAAVSPANYARRLTADGYALELRLAWEWIRTADRNLHPGIGNVFGFAVNFHDNDSKQRAGSIQWSAGMADEVWTVPQLLGTVEFLPDNKLRLIQQNSIDPAACPGTTYLSRERLMIEPGLDLLLENWKYHPGDNAEWADPAFDDRNWETYHPLILKDRFPKNGWNGIGWFRIHFIVDSSLRDVPLGLILDQSGASEVYLDGQLLYRFGNVSSDPDSEKAFLIRNPKPIVFNSQSRHLLAVRYSNTLLKQIIQSGNNGGFSCYIGEDLVLFINDRVDVVRTFSIYQIIFSVIPVVFGLLHILIFIFYPKTKENLYFSIFMFCWAFIAYTDFAGIFLTNIKQIFLIPRIANITIGSAIVFGLLTVYKSIYTKIPKQIYIFITLSAVLIIWSMINPFSTERGIYMYGLIGLTALEMFRLIIFPGFKKFRSRWIILFGFCAFSLALVYQILINLQILPSFDEYGIVYVYGLLVLSISMSVNLSHNIARTNKSLEQQLIQVKTLSQKALEQERRAKKEEIARKLLEADNARKTQELQEARKLQLSMIPKDIPSLPNLDIGAYTQPATEVGGDYYDFRVTDHTLTVAIGDATGHGMKAGTMVATIKGLFSVLSGSVDLLPFFDKCTHIIRDMNLGNLYMAMMMIRIYKNKMTVASAGMPPLYIYRNESQKVDEIILKGMPLGAHEDFSYQQKETELKPGDTILLLSDGLPELFNEEMEMFDYHRVKTAFREVAEKSPDEIIAHLNDAGHRWNRGKPPNDDITYVVLKMKNNIQ